MQEDTKTHWKLLINPEYIGAYWLPPGEDVTVVIDRVQREQVTGTGGKKEDCTVAHLKGDVKPFILNVTNSKSIAKLYGPFIEDWAGKPITLFASTTKLAGDTVECLRVRPLVAKRKKQGMTNERFTTALKAIKQGAYTAQKMEASFELTLEQQGWLDVQLEEMAGADVPEGAVNA
jgi:hypothetical protein